MLDSSENSFALGPWGSSKCMLASIGSLPKFTPPKIIDSKQPSQSSIDGRPSSGITSLGWFAARCERVSDWSDILGETQWKLLDWSEGFEMKYKLINVQALQTCDWHLHCFSIGGRANVLVCPKIQMMVCDGLLCWKLEKQNKLIC